MNEWKNGGRQSSYHPPSPLWILPLPDLLQWTLPLPHLCVTNGNSVRMGQFLGGAAQGGTRLDTALIQIPSKAQVGSTCHAMTSVAQEGMGQTQAAQRGLPPSSALPFPLPLSKGEKFKRLFSPSTSSSFYHLICLWPWGLWEAHSASAYLSFRHKHHLWRLDKNALILRDQSPYLEGICPAFELCLPSTSCPVFLTRGPTEGWIWGWEHFRGYLLLSSLKLSPRQTMTELQSASSLHLLGYRLRALIGNMLVTHPLSQATSLIIWEPWGSHHRVTGERLKRINVFKMITKIPAT